jgi:hypothetical protein
MTDKTEAVNNPDKPNNRQALEKCIAFLHSIGIKTILKQLDRGSFLPGLSIKEGSIIVDRNALTYPGDILHEAGHIAVVPAAERPTLNAASVEKRQNREAEEMMAIAWSYAACLHLDMDACFVFHDGGYKGGGSHIADTFKDKKYIGLPMLQWIGLAADEKNAAILHLPAYPCMIKWLRD